MPCYIYFLPPHFGVELPVLYNGLTFWVTVTCIATLSSTLSCTPNQTNTSSVHQRLLNVLAL